MIKYNKINSEQININIDANKYNNKKIAHEKRIDVALTLARKVHLIPNKIRFVKIRSGELLKIYNINPYLHKQLRKYTKKYDKGIVNIKEKVSYKYYIDKGEITFVFEDVLSCLGELLLTFLKSYIITALKHRRISV